jgi:hypothetical protein
MGRMKDIFTEMQELGIDPNTPEGQVKFAELVNTRFPGKLTPKEYDEEAARLRIYPGTPGVVTGPFETLAEPIQEQIRKANPNAAFEEAVQQKFQHAKHVLLSKHKDYGPKNIAHSPGGPLNGLRVRMWDKFARINNLIDSKKKPEHESLRDSFLDMANYAIIAMLVLDDEWPNE